MSAATDAWPEEDLEHLGACPACGQPARSLLLGGLTDTVFRAAPGRWSLWRCEGCGAGYLDPRPTEASIGRAYEAYYTHAIRKDDDMFSLRLRTASKRRRRRLRNSYYNRQYGHGLPGAFPGGAWLFALRDRERRVADHMIRHLPAPSAPGARLLDVGCGNGDFLPVARTLGYEPWGLEPDPMAAAAARDSGLNVQNGGLEGNGLPDGGFHYITLSHVFEHLHRPLDALAELRRLLAPDGRLWLSMPNLGALGLQHFGEAWRGLEPPRHLVLYDLDSFRGLLGRAGFSQVRTHRPSAEVAPDIFAFSARMLHGMDPYGSGDTPDRERWAQHARAADRAGARDPRVAEFITVTAMR